MSFNNVYLADLYNQSVIKFLLNPTKESYLELIKEIGGVVVESVNGGRQVKPYLDTDPVMPLDYTDDDWEADIFTTKQVILTCFLEAGITLADIHAIKRKYKVKDGIKRSVHYVVDKVRMSACNMLGMFEKLGIRGFDKGVYSKNRFLTSIYTDKKIVNNKTKSVPMFMPDGDADITKYLVSYIEEGFVDWDLNFAPKKENKKVKQDNNFLQQISKGYEDADLIKALVNCLSVIRADDYGDWLNVGFCLYCISPECLPLWEEFSKKSDKYEEGVCDKAWSKMSNKNMSVGTLKYWAKLDNPKEYERVISESREKYIELCLGSDGSHYDIAVITSKIMADKVVFDGKMKMWYFVDEKTNIWNCDKEGVKMVKILAVDVCRVFMEASDKYGNKSFNCEPQFKVSYEEKSKKCLSIAKQLKNSSFQDSVKKCCKCTFKKDDFFEKYLNKNSHLFAFTDCLFDTNLNIYRPIEPTDYVMTTTGYDIQVEDQPIYDEIVDDMLTDIQPNPNDKKYLLDIDSSRLNGTNIHQEFYFHNGKGSNGKSTHTLLLEYAFGGYYSKLRPDTITKPVKSANATSELASAVSARIVVMEEPEEDDKIQTSLMKDLCGTTITTRELFGNVFSFTPQFAIFVCCNEIPQLGKASDHAVARRIRVLNYPTKFCDYEPILPNEKQKDGSLFDKIKLDGGYKRAFIRKLIKNWCDTDLKSNSWKKTTPISVIKSSEAYLDDSNHIKKFLNDYYNKVDYNVDKSAKIRCVNLFDDFRRKVKNVKVSDKRFKELVEEQGYNWKKMVDANYYINLKEKPIVLENDTAEFISDNEDDE